MSDYGITRDGFRIRLLTDILDELHDAQRSAIRADLDLGTHTALGAIDGIMAGAISEVWQLAQHVYSSSFVDTATGEALHNLVALVGLSPKPSAPSRVTLRVHLDAGMTLPAGSVAYAESPKIRFATAADVTNTADDAAWVTVESFAVAHGPHSAAPDSITQRESRVTGWLGVTNPDSAIPGRDAETDAELRARYRLSLSAVGSSTEGAITNRLLDLDGVRAVRLFTSVDSPDVPERAFEVVVDGGSDADVAEAIELSRPVCTGTHGSTTVTINSIPHDGMRRVRFSRPTRVPIFVRYHLRVDPTRWDESALRSAVATYLDSLGMGGTVQFYRLVSLALSSIGVADIASLPLLGRDEMPSTPDGHRENISLEPRSTPHLEQLHVVASLA